MYCASSSPHVSGQLSLSIAVRRISSPNTALRITVLGGYGAALRTAVHQRLHHQLIHRPPEPRACVSPNASPFRTTIRSRLGTTTITWCCAPAPANVSRGAAGQIPSALVYHARPDAGAGSVGAPRRARHALIGQHLLHHLAPDQRTPVPRSPQHHQLPDPRRRARREVAPPQLAYSFRPSTSYASAVADGPVPLRHARADRAPAPSTGCGCPRPSALP